MNEVIYEQGGKAAVFQGKRYFLRESQGYFYCHRRGRIHMLLHRMVWISHFGEIKNGYEIHHIDGNKNNNEIENLECLSIRQHKIHHGKILTEEQKEKMRENLIENVRPKASEWHGSTAGIEWHKQHYEDMKDKLHEKSEYDCKWCGKKYITQKAEKNTFCSQNCRNKDRRARGVDNEKRICEYCGKEFEVNKYEKTITCSRKCGAQNRKRKAELNKQTK